MHILLQNLKSELKALIPIIRQAKYIDKDLHTAHWRGQEFRYLHVVYCLLRGRTLEQIENKNRSDNELKASRLYALWAVRTGLDYPNKPAYMEVADETPLCPNP